MRKLRCSHFSYSLEFSLKYYPCPFQATLHRVLRHLVLHRHRLAAIEHELLHDRAEAASTERKLGQALSVEPTINMSYKQTKAQQHQLSSTIRQFAPQVTIFQHWHFY
jgi:hypothetical protein